MKELPEDIGGEMRERLLVHFVQGAWRAPLSVRMVAGPFGPVVAAGPADVGRIWPLAEGAGAFGRVRAARLSVLRHGEGFEDAPGDLPQVPELPARPVLLSAAEVPLALILALLRAGMRGGMVWKPAPGAAASAHEVMDVLGPAAGGRLSMLQGDHASGALLSQVGPVIWASPSPPPPGLRPALAFSASAPRRP